MDEEQPRASLSGLCTAALLALGSTVSECAPQETEKHSENKLEKVSINGNESPTFSDSKDVSTQKCSFDSYYGIHTGKRIEYVHCAVNRNICIGEFVRPEEHRMQFVFYC
ncbi:hypothetical protein NDU88_000528 [Pleurodeles waltl]|uniref:Secreted protein n=1 Tax=Pleurodeles waltl TaxID=8319 RepID=A0AAV7N880_PLEWA|nr:hypothetical protein NDU88_000528 [Pleurodeles waltl]